MGVVALMTLLNREESVLSTHFGKAKWISLLGSDGKIKFLENTGLNGRFVVDVLVANGCTDVVFGEIGFGALRHLQAAGIHGWFGPLDKPVPELLEMLRQQKLERATAPRDGHVNHGCGQHSHGERSDATGEQRGCCCHR